MSSTPSSQKKADGVSTPPLQIIDIEDLCDRRATDANMTNAKMDAKQKVVRQVREKDSCLEKNHNIVVNTCNDSIPKNKGSKHTHNASANDSSNNAV